MPFEAEEELESGTKNLPKIYQKLQKLYFDSPHPFQNPGVNRREAYASPQWGSCPRKRRGGLDVNATADIFLSRGSVLTSRAMACLGKMNAALSFR
jgi:hypothetical protein